MNSPIANDQAQPISARSRHPSAATRNTTLGAALALLLTIPAVAAPPATTFRENPDGVGHMLLVPYFTVQGGNATLLNITNTDLVNGKAVKLRFRGAGNADRLLDFSVFLAPGDVWTAELNQNPATGLARLVTSDTSCTLPTQVSVDFATDRVNQTYPTYANETREGYVEILSMADIAPGTALFTATKPSWVPGGPVPPAPCSNGAMAPPALAALLTPVGIAAAQLAPPTTGIFASWVIFNTTEATSWAGAATALEAVAANGAPGAGLVVMQPQTSQALALVTALPTASLTADPLLRLNIATPLSADIPDLSTPYVSGFDPLQQIANISKALAKTTVTNEYFTDDTVQAQTDFVITLPTRRYIIAGSNTGGGFYVSDPGSEYFSTADIINAGGYIAPPTRHCLYSYDASFFDRKAQHDLNESLPPPYFQDYGYRYWMCGGTTVTSINDGSQFSKSVLNSSTMRNNNEVTFQDGWIRVISNSSKGIPLIGAVFSKAVNPNVRPGVMGSYGLLWPHRYTRPAN